jgi:hypothetical protein
MAIKREVFSELKRYLLITLAKHNMAKNNISKT